MLKQKIFNRKSSLGRDNTPLKITEENKRFSLPPPPKASDPDIQLICKKFSTRLSDKNKKAIRQKLLEAKKSLYKIIKQCFQYHQEDDINFTSKYNYRLFLEHYYQKKFAEMVETIKKMENTYPKLAKRYFDYSFLQENESLVQANEIIKEYKSGLADPCRYVAYHERTLSTKAGRLNKRRQ
ncbi:unnamed protein product [Moneuplotes crassus]|uniref:Uncharacterized protein n=1 Tax=Euplotes crassus TaxID=5936 RepID=A0AAD1Y5T4_EUPCR|nr:unnamed protein product [Moneuplotes crassus]